MCKNVYYYFYDNQLKGGGTNEMLSNRRSVSDNIVWTYKGTQCRLETACFGREFSDLWNVNSPLFNDKNKSQSNKSSIPISCTKYMHKKQCWPWLSLHYFNLQILILCGFSNFLQRT